jgi:hypothetical protein
MEINIFLFYIHTISNNNLLFINNNFNQNSMKAILSLVLLIPTLMFGQVSSWRQTGGSVPVSSQTTQSSNVHQSVSQQQNNVSQWRTQTAPIRPGDNFQGQPLTRRYRYTDMNPYGLQYGIYGYYQPYPYTWYDDYGWRQRSVIHVYENGKRDTIRKERVHTAFGFGYTNNKQAAYWGMVGSKKGYFIMDYVMTYAVDQNQYYPYGQINNVDFPLSKEDWKKESTFYVGVGKRIGEIGIHGMIGFGSEVIRWQGKDDLGGISFPKSNSSFTTFKIGIIRDFKFFTLKLDNDPIRGYTQIGIGLNNK